MPLYIIYLVLTPVLWGLTLLAGAFNKKIRTRLLQQSSVRRKALANVRRDRGSRTLILFHAASAGEFEQLKPVLARVDRERYFILQTFYSPTIFSEEQDSRYFDAVCYQPFDFPWSVSRFFRDFEPRTYVITRHDIWPNHVFFARRRGIRVYLINANMYGSSSRLKWPMLGFNKWLFGSFDMIMTGSESLRTNLSVLVAPERVEVTGDTRFDRIVERKTERKEAHLPEEMLETENIILGSISGSDHDVVFGGLAMRYENGDASLKEKGHRLIIVPHEVDERELASVEERCRKIGLTVQRYSAMNGGLVSRTVLVDAVGILADLYAYAKLAYVGGGFGAGVHSVTEPAVHGAVVSFGPSISILDEAVALHESGIGSMVRSPEEFSEFLSLLSKADELRTLSKRTLEFVEESRGAADRVLSTILSE